MLGITVGVDGSDNSRRALDWAMREAAARRCPMTVITVHEVVPSLWTGDPVTTRADEALQHRARDAAVAAATAAAERLGENQPTAVKVRAVSGFAAQELINASGVTDLLVIGARGGGFSHRLALGSVSSQRSCTTPTVRWSSFPSRPGPEAPVSRHARRCRSGAARGRMTSGKLAGRHIDERVCARGEGAGRGGPRLAGLAADSVASHRRPSPDPGGGMGGGRAVYPARRATWRRSGAGH